MSQQFENVTAVAKANIYFDGRVASHTILFADGEKKTLGLIYPGQYHFGTDAAEIMQVTAGQCSVKLDGTADWKTYTAGDEFHIPAKSGFDIAVADELTQYVCSYVK